VLGRHGRRGWSQGGRMLIYIYIYMVSAHGRPTHPRLPLLAQVAGLSHSGHGAGAYMFRIRNSAEP